jgi:hypothetical protein
MQKGGRLAPDKDANEQQHNIVEKDQDAEKSMKKSARKSCKRISFLKDISHIWTALLGLVKHASHVLNVDFRSICWVGGTSAEVMRRADAGATASAEVTLVGSTADSITTSEIQAVVLIMTTSSMELMDTRLCTLATWRKEREEALMLMTRVGAAIARGNEDLRRTPLRRKQSDNI